MNNISDDLKDLLGEFEEIPEEILWDKCDQLEKNLKEAGVKDWIGKKILFFDTETTGLPNNYYAPTTDTLNWPHLVQLSWIVTDETGREIKARNYIIKPCHWEIPTQATAIHGITQEQAKTEGKPITEVLEKFMWDLDESSLVVGHNISFDKSIVGCELERTHTKDRIANKPDYDTMIETADLCQIEWSDYYCSYKWPKLQELYFKLFGRHFKSAHNAVNDTRATMECFFELVRLGEININKLLYQETKKHG